MNHLDRKAFLSVNNAFKEIAPLQLEERGHGLKEENLKKETESFLIAAQINAIRTNYIKPKIDYMLNNC